MLCPVSTSGRSQLNRDDFDCLLFYTTVMNIIEYTCYNHDTICYKHADLKIESIIIAQFKIFYFDNSIQIGTAQNLRAARSMDAAAN